MSRLLILYGTTDGHTEKIARFLASELRSDGATVDVLDARTSNPQPGDYAGVLVAASIHAWGYQRAVVRWVRAHADALRGKPSAFLSVCLAVLQKDLKVQRELGGIINRFEARTGWKPTRVKIVAGALPYTRYGWLKRAVMRRIVKKAGGSTDVSRDHEYTDWSDLLGFAGTFHVLCEGRPAPLETATGASGCSGACCCSGVEISA
ncbi:MAG TPA: flavodoxin domain-containing protein [Gemmatimonadales bacterium]|jgi:menaquinone-dependent protoporphyrinogen oxidase|nr:flavodoxin domain-containing protein [Gemmatimonadales bacterium]